MKTTILVIEDNPMKRQSYKKTIQEIAKRNGKKVAFIEARDEEKALKAIAQGGFDIVILDGYLLGTRTSERVAPALKASEFAGPVVFASMGDDIPICTHRPSYEKVAQFVAEKLLD